MLELGGLCAFAFLAGFIDSMVGGGGLIQLPALFIFFPNTPITALFGTNKLSSISGTSAAAIRFIKEVKLDWQALIPAAITALIFSFIGARTVSLINSEVLRPLILILLIIVAIYTFIIKDFGSEYQPKYQGNKVTYYMMLIAATIGFYDGFFGPGTGSFLIFLFIVVLGFDFIRASAIAKIINFSTNVAALIYFASINQILYNIAIPMALCNAIGGIVGAKMAIVKGSAFVRILFLVVVSVLIIKLAYDMFHK
jgi:uncharacterized membrane protein YfcA